MSCLWKMVIGSQFTQNQREHWSGVLGCWLMPRIKLKKVGKTTGPFRYDLNQIPYDYTVKVRNRFKGLDLIRQSA